jgi:hypothetical protein
MRRTRGRRWVGAEGRELRARLAVLESCALAGVPWERRGSPRSEASGKGSRDQSATGEGPKGFSGWERVGWSFGRLRSRRVRANLSPKAGPRKRWQGETDPFRRIPPRTRAHGSHGQDTHPPPSGCRAGTSWPALSLHPLALGRLAPGAPGRGPAPGGRAGAPGRASSRRAALGASWRGWAASPLSPRNSDGRTGPRRSSAATAAARASLLSLHEGPDFIWKPKRAGLGETRGLFHRGRERSDVSL